MWKTLSLVGLILLLSASTSPGKPPALDYLFPAGAQRGQTIEVHAGGSFDTWPLSVRVEGPGVEVEPTDEKGTLRVNVADDAPTGIAWLRLYNAEGASPRRPFLVGSIPEVLEDETNDDPGKAQVIDGDAVTVNGRLSKRGDVDGFAVDLDQGQTLVASMVANTTLGSPMDSTLQVATPDGFVLAHVDDDHGLDPLLVFNAPEDGTYVVRTFAFPAEPTSSIRFDGEDRYVYRLTLTTRGFADHPYPLAVSRDEPGSVEISGWNVPEEARSLPVQPDDTSEVVTVEHPELANPVAVRLVPHSATLEREPNDVDNPQAIEGPLTLTGRIDPEGDRDTFQFVAKKGESRRFWVESRSLGYPLDPLIRVLDDNGKILVEQDDADREGRDAKLDFKAPGDGTYRLVIRDLNGFGGPRYVYRLDALTPEPDFRLSVKGDRFILEPGKSVEVPVSVERRDGFGEKIEITLDPDGLPEGVESKSVTSEPKGDSSKAVKLILTSKDAAGWSGTFAITGHAVGEGERTRSAVFALEGLDATTDRGWLTVLPPKEPDETTTEKNDSKKDES